MPYLLFLYIYIYIYISNGTGPQVEIKGAPDIYVNSGSQVELVCLLTDVLEEPPFIFWHYGDERLVMDRRPHQRGPPSAQAWVAHEITSSQSPPSEQGNESINYDEDYQYGYDSYDVYDPYLMVSTSSSINRYFHFLPLSDWWNCIQLIRTDGIDLTTLSVYHCISDNATYKKKIIKQTNRQKMKYFDHSSPEVASEGKRTARKPSVRTWSITRIEPGVIVSRLSITNPSRSDSGHYQCRPSNMPVANVTLHVLDGAYRLYASKFKGFRSIGGTSDKSEWTE